MQAIVPAPLGIIDIIVTGFSWDNGCIVLCILCLSQLSVLRSETPFEASPFRKGRCKTDTLALGVKMPAMHTIVPTVLRTFECPSLLHFECPRIILYSLGLGQRLRAHSNMPGILGQ